MMEIGRRVLGRIDSGCLCLGDAGGCDRDRWPVTSTCRRVWRLLELWMT